MRNDNRVCTMCECAGGKAGVPKTQNITRDLQYTFESTLALGNLRFAKNLVTYKSTPEELKAKLLLQMGNYRWEEIGNPGEGGDQKFKLHGKSGGNNDDLLVSCMMVPMWSVVFLRSQKPEYEPFQYFARNGYFKSDIPLRAKLAGNQYSNM